MRSILIPVDAGICAGQFHGRVLRPGPGCRNCRQDVRQRGGCDLHGCRLLQHGAIREAKKAPGRYIIGVDSDQTHLGPGVVLASAVKRVDRVVYTGIGEYLNGSFTGGEQAAGLKEGVTGLSFNPKFAAYNSTVRAWEAKAQEEEAKYLAVPCSFAAEIIRNCNKISGNQYADDKLHETALRWFLRIASTIMKFTRFSGRLVVELRS